jgi:Tfp pilus assembly protein PilN
VIRTNLSTRPFYNERAVRLWLLAFGAVVVAATLFNLAGLVRYSTADTALGTEAVRDEARAASLRAEAARLRATVDPRQLALASDRAKLANALIDRRTFSWTELFNQFEATLPDDVRITSVRPNLDAQRGFVVDVTIVARSVDDVDRFMQNLEATGAFSAVNSPEEHVDEQGQLNATVEAIYKPASTAGAGGKRP